MSEADNKEAPKDTASGKVQHFATLKHGRVYFLGEKQFEHGKPTPVTLEEAEHLDEHAVDRVTLTGGSTSGELRKKFELTEADVAPAKVTPKK